MPKTPLAFAALGTATLFLVSGIKGVTVADVLAGKATDPLDPKGGIPANDLGTDGTITTTGGGDFPTGPGAAVGGITIFDGKPVASWIVPQLKYARKNGWRGHVTSGYRDPRVKVTPSPGLPVAPQGKSNHNGTAYPKGAVDVTDPDGLQRALAFYPGGHTLIRGIEIKDPIHFSATGR